MKRDARALAHCSFPFPVAIHLPTRRASTPIRKAAAITLFALLLCAGCVATMSVNKSCGSCGSPVDACGECDEPVCEECGECAHPVGHTIPGVGFCCGAWESMCCFCSPVVSWPCHKVCHVVNFCAPDGCCGPPPPPGPGRFHPVPTHPVFEPVPEAMTFPAK